MTIGEKIKNRRIQLGISLQRVADYCGVNKSTISRWESGETEKINLGMLFLLSKVLYVEPLELLDNASDISINKESSLLNTIISKVKSLSEDELKKLYEIIKIIF